MLKSAFVFILTLLYSIYSIGQPSIKKTISINEAVSIALTNNPLAKNAELNVQITKTRSLSSIDLGATEINYLNGQMYTASNDKFLEIDQHLGSPLTHIQKGKYNKQAIVLCEAEQKLIIKKLTADVKISYINFLYHFTKLKVLNQINFQYNDLLNITGVPYNKSDTNQLNRITAETHFADFQNQLFQEEQDYHLAGNQLQQLLNITEKFVPSDSSLELYAIEILNSGPDKFYPKSKILLYNEVVNLHQKKLLVEQSKLFPEVTVGYFNHDINNAKGFEGIKLGIAVPIWYFPQKAKINEARINQKIAKNELDYQKFNITKTIENLKIQLDKYFVSISFYRENALKKADLLLQTTNLQLQKREIDYSNIYINLESALKIQLDYLTAVKQYNQTAIQLESYVD